MKLTDYGEWTIIALPDDPIKKKALEDWYIVSQGWGHPPTHLLQLPQNKPVVGHLTLEEVLELIPDARYYYHLTHGNHNQPVVLDPKCILDVKYA